MPRLDKPLFRHEVVAPKVRKSPLNQNLDSVRLSLGKWVSALQKDRVQKMKETELLPDFLRDVFIEILGYTGPSSDLHTYTFRREALIEVDGKRADGAIGEFGDTDRYVIVIEGKGPLDPLDRPFAGRKRSAAEQAMNYAVQLKIDWYLVTNLNEIRLFNKANDTLTFERFELARMVADERELRRFLYLLDASRIIGKDSKNHLNELLAESRTTGREVTNQFYHEYKQLRKNIMARLKVANPNEPPGKLLTATQKMLDRVLFVAFCEDRGLLPSDIIEKAYQLKTGFVRKPIWNNFVELFAAVDKGNGAEISAYNGGLFAEDPYLDNLKVPDEICEGLRRIGEYEYGEPDEEDSDGRPNQKRVDVEILGHIFEQSITDLEELARSPDAVLEVDSKAPSKRKKEGAFYTPDFVTRYIVAETLQPVLVTAFEETRQKVVAATPKAKRAILEDPRGYDRAKLSKTERETLAEFWTKWEIRLTEIRIVDPSCGSGAFLIQAFEQLKREYQECTDRMRELNVSLVFDIDREILTHNIFGMDLNTEAVEIARLSLWIKTAQPGRPLTSLDNTIVQGNSVIGVDKSPLEHWQHTFPSVFAAGGFDVVIGNPPYVRQEWIKADKPYLEKHYNSFDSVADLYVYFYELALNILKPDGRLGYIVTNKWLKARYGEPLRRYFSKNCWVEQLVDFGHAKQIFPDAEVFPCILIARKPSDKKTSDEARVCIIPKDQLQIDDLSRQIHREGVIVSRGRFDSKGWDLESTRVSELMTKLKSNGRPLKDYIKMSPFYGIKTGCNDAIVIDSDKKNELIKKHKSSATLIKKYLRGQDINRWSAFNSDLWMILIKSSLNFDWEWSQLSNVLAEKRFQELYPAIYEHLIPNRERLVNRVDQGKFWWELRSCAYWEAFEKPKIIYQDLSTYSRFALDEIGIFSNDTTFFIPSTDYWILAVLNSPLIWTWLSRNTILAIGGTLRLKSIYMEQVPIADPTEFQRVKTEEIIAKLILISKEQQSGNKSFLDWLKVEFEIEKPSQKLANVAGLDENTLLSEVKKIRGKSKPLSVRDIQRLKQEYFASITPIQTLATEALGLEKQVSDLVNEAYGLTPEDVALMWETAPPRMPIPAP